MIITCDAGTANAMAVITMPYVSVSNQHTVHLKVAQCYISIVSQ